MGVSELQPPKTPGLVERQTSYSKPAGSVNSSQPGPKGNRGVAMSGYGKSGGLRGRLMAARIAMRSLRLSRAEWIVAEYLFRLMIGANSMSVCPKHATIARETRQSVSTVQRALARLAARGLVVVRQRLREVGLRCRRLVSNAYALGAQLLAIQPQSGGPLGSVRMTEQGATNIKNERDNEWPVGHGGLLTQPGVACEGHGARPWLKSAVYRRLMQGGKR